MQYKTLPTNFVRKNVKINNIDFNLIYEVVVVYTNIDVTVCLKIFFFVSSINYCIWKLSKIMK